MTSVAPNASDGLLTSDEEMQHWQRVEAEAWGSGTYQTTTDLQAEDAPEPAKEASRPIAFFALLALVAFAALWLYTRQSAGDEAGSAPKAITTPAAAREVPDPCTLLAQLRTVQADAYVRLLGQEDPVQRAAIIGQQSRKEIRLIDQLLEVEPALTMSVAPIRFRSQKLVDGMPDVDSGNQTIDQLLASTADIDAQAADGDQAVAAYQAERCPSA